MMLVMSPVQCWLISLKKDVVSVKESCFLVLYFHETVLQHLDYTATISVKQSLMELKVALVEVHSFKEKRHHESDK